jgi:hypothetical protein
MSQNTLLPASLSLSHRDAGEPSGKFSISRCLLGLLGLGSCTSIVAYFSGSNLYEASANQTLGGFISQFWWRLTDGYYGIIDFFANMELSTAGSLVLVFSALLAKLYNRRITTTLAQKQYFEAASASSIPHTRIGYSDRMSYTMGELAELAYVPAESLTAMLSSPIPSLISNLQTWKESVKLGDQESKELEQVLAPFLAMQGQTSNELLPEGLLPKKQSAQTANERYLFEALNEGQFEFVGPYLSNQNIDIAEPLSSTISKCGAQGYVCMHKNEDPQKSFIVVAFRGTESNVEDWLTNVNAKPLVDDELTSLSAKLDEYRNKHGFIQNESGRIGRVHSGFYAAFMALAPQLMSNIAKAKYLIDNAHCPIYFTGHSLGGAMATIAARELTPDSNGAVYSFGAPRVADYNYFNGMKTPIFRIVNSSDIVPRVPPGIFAPVFKLPIYLLRWLFAVRQGIENPEHPLIAKLLDKGEKFFDDLSYYRHYGDLRYLTDVTDSKEVKADILSNPSKFDQIFWFCSSVGASFGKPVKSHSMQIYRNKLKKIARARN